MNETNDQKLQDALRRAFAPVDRELRRDLWPQMLRRLEQPPLRVPWFDWALVALLAVWLIFFPEAIPTLFYHL